MSRPGRNIVEYEGADPSRILDDINGHPEPVVFRGLCSHWPIVRAANGEFDAAEQYLLSHYAGAPVTAFFKAPGPEQRIFYNEDYSGLNFRQFKTRLDEVLAQIREASGQSSPPTVYMGSMALDHCLPGIKSDNSLPTHDFSATVRIWIGNRSKVAAHHDVMDNIASVCAGTRRFMLFPPEQLANLYLGPLDVTPAGQQISIVDPDDPDLQRFPRYAQALEHSQWAELAPGDAIYIPSMWWHQVSALSDFNILINHWWRDTPDYMGAPGDVLVHALLNMRNLPERQRTAWREILDHYVFDPPHDALDHIPENSRGILGGADETSARQWRMLLRNKLNR